MLSCHPASSFEAGQGEEPLPQRGCAQWSVDAFWHESHERNDFFFLHDMLDKGALFAQIRG